MSAITEVLHDVFMFANTHFHVTSQHHDVTSILIAIQWDSLCSNCRFLKTGLVDHIGVLQTPVTPFLSFQYIDTKILSQCPGTELVSTYFIFNEEWLDKPDANGQAISLWCIKKDYFTATCKLCNPHINIAHMGYSALKQHSEKKKHKGF